MSAKRRGTAWQRDPTPDAPSRQAPAVERIVIRRAQEVLRSSILVCNETQHASDEILALCIAAGILARRNGSTTSHAILASARNALPYIDAMWDFLTTPQEGNPDESESADPVDPEDVRG